MGRIVVLKIPHTKKLAIQTTVGRPVSVFMVIVLVISMLVNLNWGGHNNKVLAASSYVETNPDADSGVQAWRTAGTLNTTPCTTQCDYVDDTSAVSTATADADYLRVLTTDAGNEVDEFTTADPSFTGTVSAITSVDVTFRAKSVACIGTGGTPCDSVTTNIFINGGYQTAQSQTITATLATYTKTFVITGSPTNANDLRIQIKRVAQGSSTNKDEVWVTQIYAKVNYSYTPEMPIVNQQAYVFQNDDGTTGDNVTSAAAANTPLTGVTQGDRLTLRTQLRNTGGPVQGDLGLFYDHNDGVWTRVNAKDKAVTTAGSGCADTAWTCTKIDSTSKNVGQYSSLGFDPRGRMWLSTYDATATQPRIISPTMPSAARTGGTCDSANFACTNIRTTSNSGQYSSMAFNSLTGLPSYSMYDSTGGDLYISQLTTAGGGGCSSVDWNCAIVDSTNNVGQYTSTAIDAAGSQWISYYDVTNGALRVANYVGSGGTCTNTAYNCKAIDTTNSRGQYTSLAIDGKGRAWVAYYEATGGNLRIAHYVGSGGSGCTAGVSDWTCATVETTNDVGSYASIAIDANGDPWISYYDATSGGLRVAYCANSVTTGCDNTPGVEWTFTAVDTGNATGQYTSMAFDAGGAPWISYYKGTGGDLMVTHYVGSGGSGCTSSAWSCTAVATANDFGQYSSLAFDDEGNPNVAYYDAGNGDQYIAKLIRSGEISVSPAQSVSPGSNSLTKSMADNTPTTGDCITGGTTWNTGAWFEGYTGPAGSLLPKGSVTPQCTEVAWTVDTSNATPGTTYRFVIATKDSYSTSKNPWRAPTTITQYPTITIDSPSVIRYGKDVTPYWSACTLTTWACSTITSGAGIGQMTSMDFDHEGTPWIAYYDSTGLDLYVANYVGTGGNCSLSGGGTNTQWNCTAVDTGGSVGINPSLAISADGVPWVSYYDTTNTALKVAQYVGSGGSGCASSAWSCDTVDTAGTNTGNDGAIAFDGQGVPWVTYAELRTRLARYVGSGGSGCTSSAWNGCFQTTGAAISLGPYSFGFDADNNMVSTFTDSGGPYLQAFWWSGSTTTARCNLTEYGCNVIDSTNGSATSTGHSMVYDANHNFKIPYYRSSGTPQLKLLRFTGSAAATPASTDCVGGATENQNVRCDVIDNTNEGREPNIANDINGDAWVSYNDTGSGGLKYAKYTPGTGSGCSNTNYTCATVDATTTAGRYTSIAFDHNGLPWISHYDTSGALKISKLLMPDSQPTFTSPIDLSNQPHSAHASFPRYRLDIGKTAATAPDGTCAATSDKKGYCALFTNDGNYDSLTASNGDEMPMYYMSTSYTSNAQLPTASWIGKTNLAPNTAGTAGDIKLQVYRYGTTNAWEDVASNTTSSDCTADNCKLTGIPSGTANDYFQTDGAVYWVHYRLLQIPDNSTSITLKTDSFVAVQPQQRAKAGLSFRGEKRLPLNSN